MIKVILSHDSQELLHANQNMPSEGNAVSAAYMVDDTRLRKRAFKGDEDPEAPSLKGDPDEEALDLQYAIEDTPPWYLCIILGFQVSWLSPY